MPLTLENLQEAAVDSMGRRNTSTSRVRDGNRAASSFSSSRSKPKKMLTGPKVAGSRLATSTNSTPAGTWRGSPCSMLSLRG